MNGISRFVDLQLRRWVTPSRVAFLCGGYLVCQLLVFLSAVSVPGMEDRLGFVRGRDLLQFYLSGRMVAQGEAGNLYDHEAFTRSQYELHPLTEANREKNPPYFSLYPPPMALIMSLPARLSYDGFVVLGWLWTIGGLLIVARWVIRDLNPSAEWRTASWLAVLGFHSVIVMLWNGQFSWLWSLSLLACFRCRRSGHDFAAGLCLSILTLKPQFAAVAGLWLLMRGAWRTMAGLGIGFLAQAAVVAVVLGPSIWRDYFVGARIYSNLSSLYQFDPEYQQAILGIFQGLLGGEQLSLCRALHLIIAAGVVGLVFRVVRSKPADHRAEESAVILLVLLVMPHLLIYDLLPSLLVMAHLVTLHSECPDRLPLWPAAALYGLTMIAPAYRAVPGFSLVPLAMLASLWLLDRRTSRSNTTADSSKVDRSLRDRRLRVTE